MGGMLRAIETGYVQSEIQKAAYQYQQAVERGEVVVVGVNRFTMKGPAPFSIFRLDPSAEKLQIERLHALRASRDSSLVRRSLRQLEDAATGGDNLMPFIFDAAEACATVGEISDTLRAVFGEYRETPREVS